MADSAALIWCPFPDEAAALAVIRPLLDQRLIACANILPSITSVYLWQGAVEQSREVGVVFKTTAALLDSAVQEIAARHPYDTPAVIGWEAKAQAPATLEWLNQSLGNL